MPPGACSRTGLTARRPEPILGAVAMDVYDTLSHPLALAVFVFTLFLPVLVGFVTVRRTRSQSDFFVGGRGMHRVATSRWPGTTSCARC